jgi:asparagine synthase (glutamine-hydrolysing)
MPGITGIITNRLSENHRVQLDAMIKSLVHEDFHKPGTVVNEETGVALGWVSHAGSFSDCMPVWNEDKSVLLVLHGEVYQDGSRIEELRKEGHRFSGVDASFLVHLYEKLGQKFLAEMNGWFSGVIVDLREKQAVLFNDRFGVGRVCYHEDKDGFYFSSEAKSLLKVLPQLRSLDQRSLGEVLSSGTVLRNRTLFSGVSLVPAGSAWSFSKMSDVRKNVYFRPQDWEEQPKLTEAEYYEQLKETWKRVLPNYFPGSERSGLSLTGGVDSRMILAWAPCAAGELPCYTFSGRYRDCNDVKLARQLANVAGQPYQTIPIDGPFLSEFPSLAEKVAYIGEGNLDVSGAIDLFVQREARKIAPARVTGTNGGELLRRLVMFKPSGVVEEMVNPDLGRSIDEAAATYFQELDCHRLSFAAFKQTPWFMNSKFMLERSQITMRLPFCDNELVRLSYQAPPSQATSNEPALRLISEGSAALGQIGTDRALYLNSALGITKVRHLIQQFTFKAEYAYDMGMPQWLARADRALSPLRLEGLFLGRHKFHHFRVYYRDELSSYIREILLDSRTLNRSFLNKPAIEEMVRGHVSGYQNYTSEIHRLLTIELVQRQLIEQN